MSANKFSLPPNVKGTQRGVLSIAVQEADAPVYLLWWGETREMRLTPKSIGTVFDQSSLEVPIFTSVERFISYLLDDPVIDVRVGDEVGTIDLLPFVTDTNLILDGRFRIGNLNVSLSMKTVWTNVVQPSRATAAAQGSRGFQNSPDPVNGSAADQWAALAERAEKLREDMNTRNNLPSPPYGGKDWSSSGLGLSAVAGEPTASAGGEPVLESIIASDPLHTASQVDDGAQAEQQSGSGNNLASDGVHAFNLALSPSPHVTIDLSSNSKNTSTSENASATTRIEPPQQASSTSKAIPARAVVALQWVSFRGMNVKRASVLLKGSDSIGEMVSAQSLRAQTMHVQKEVKKELVSKVYFSQEAAQRDYSRGVLSSNSPALTCKGGPAELRFEIALDTAGRSGEGTGSSLMGPYTAAASSSAAATTAEMKSRGPATVRLLHVTAYSSTSEFSALKLIENGCSAEVPVNSDCLDREEWTVPLYSGKKIVGKACMRVKLFPLKQQLQLQLGAVGNLGSLDPRSLYASYKLPNSAGKSSSRATAEIETPWMPPAHFRYSAQHAFDAGSGPGKLFLQLWQQSATDASGKTLLGLCKLQVPWPDGRMSCAASIQPVVATSGALPSIDLSLRCSTAFADELEPTTGGGTTVVGNSTARAENASSSRAAPVEDVAQEKSASAVVNNLPSSSTHVSDIAGLEGQPPVVVQQPQAAFSATTTNLPLSNATMGQQEQFGGSSGSSAFLTSGPQLASREVFRSALRGMVANAIGSDTDFLADPGQHQDPTTGGQDDDAFDLRTLEKHLTASGLARTRADAVALSNEMAVAADGERIFRDRNGGNERIPATFVREWIRRRVSPVRDALSRIVALSDDPNGLLGEVLRTLVLDRSRLLTEAEFVNLFRERFEDSISSEVGTLTVCCQEIYRSLDADSSALDAACLGGLLESFLERRQDDDFRARRGLAAFASTTPASKVKQLFKAYVFGVEALVPPAADSYRRRPSVGYVGIHESSIAYAGGSGGTSRAQQGSRLLQGTCSSKNKATSPQSRSPRTKIPFSQSAFAHLVPAKNGSKNSASSSGEEEGQQQSVGQTQRLFRLPKLERRRISVVHRKAFEHVLWEEGIVGLSQSDVRCLAEYLEPSSHRGHVNLDLLTSEIQRLGTENDDMEVEGEEGIGSPRTVAGPSQTTMQHQTTMQQTTAAQHKTAALSPSKSGLQTLPKLPSHPAAVSIVKELLSLVISGCVQMPDAIAVLDNAAGIIARNPNRDDVAIAVAAWRELSIVSSGLAAVLALQSLCSWSKAQRRMEVTEANVKKMQKVFFYFYDFENNSLFLKLFEVILASHVDPIKAFHILDTDKDGRLRIDDFILMSKKLGLPLSDSDKDCYQRYGSKDFTLEEFLESFNRFRSRRFGYVDEVPHQLAPTGGAPLPAGIAASPFHVDLSQVGDTARRDLFLRTNQYCFNLPSYFTFALLETYEGEAEVELEQDEDLYNAESRSSVLEVSRSTLLRFVYQVLGGGIMSQAEARRTLDIIDVTNKDNVAGEGYKARCPVAYKDFRRYWQHVDGKRAVAKPGDQETLATLRGDIREFLDIATAADLNLAETATVAKVDLTGAITEDGLARLLRELRVADSVARPVFEWACAVCAFHGLGVPSYKRLFSRTCVRACVHLRRHLDDLFALLMFAGLQRIEDLVDPVPVGDRLKCDEFKQKVVEAAENEGIASRLVSLDWDDVFAAASYNGWVCLSELALAYKEFQMRYGVLMAELAKRMDALSISAHELFAAARKSTGS